MAATSEEKDPKWICLPLPLRISGIHGNDEFWKRHCYNLVVRNDAGEGLKLGLAGAFFTTAQVKEWHRRLFPSEPEFPEGWVLAPLPTDAFADLQLDYPPFVQAENDAFFAAARELHTINEARHQKQYQRKQRVDFAIKFIIEKIKQSMPKSDWEQMMSGELEMFEVNPKNLFQRIRDFSLLEQGGRLVAIKAAIDKRIGPDELASAYIRRILELFRSLDCITGRPTDKFIILDKIYEALASRMTVATGSMYASYNTLKEALATSGERLSDYTLDRFIIWVNNWEKVHFETATAESLALSAVSAVQTDPSSDLLRKIRTLEVEVSELKRTSPAQGAGSQAGIAGANTAQNPPGSGKKAKARAAAAAAAAVLAGGGGAAAIGGGAKQQQVACSFCKYTNHPAAKCRFNPANALMTLEEFNVFAKRT